MQKFAKDSLTTMTEMILPNDTNTLNNLMGGKMMYWMDIAAAIAAQKHSGSVVVTASVDNISYSETHQAGPCYHFKSTGDKGFYLINGSFYRSSGRRYSQKN